MMTVIINIINLGASIITIGLLVERKSKDIHGVKTDWEISYYKALSIEPNQL
jgi:hypothetical protein